MPVVPGPTAIFDNANRANGAAYDGTGAAIWDDKFIGGATGALVVDSSKLKVTSSDQGAITADTFTDSFTLIFLDTVTSGALGFYWRLQNADASWTGYWFVADGLNWAIKKRTVGGGGGDVTLDSATVVSSLTLGVGIRVYGTTFEVYRYEDNAWEQTPVLSATGDTDFASGPNCVNLPNDTWIVDRIETADASLEPPDGPFTIYVDADHPDASDEYSRLEASDPDTPLLTPDRAGMLAYATETWGDTILLKRADAANPEDERGEMTCYPVMDHRLNTRGARPAGYPFGDNTGNLPITVKGEIVADVRAALRGFTSRRLKNWAFEDLQFGYDVDGGNDYLTLNAVERGEDLTYTNCLFTGGGNQYSYWAGTIHHEGCTVRAPLSPSANDPFDGRGFGTSPDPNDSDGGQNSGVVEWVDCQFGPVRGNDAIQASVGAYLAASQWGSVLVRGCVFTDVIEGASQFHTDSVQVLGGPLFEIEHCIFIGCSTSIIASDFHNGTIRFDANLIVGAGAQITIQGTDTLKMRNNTVLTYGALSNTALFLVDRTTGVTTLGDVRNNIFQSVYYRDRPASTWWAEGTVFDNNIVIQDPGTANPWGTNLPGIPELGTTTRVDALDLPASYVMTELPDPLTLAFELANSPFDSPGLGEGIVVEDDDFPATDLLGRAWDVATPDVGCFQSDPGTVVTPTARPPYILSRFPASGAAGVAEDVSVTAELYPVPGVGMDDTTVTTTNAYVSDPDGETIPAIVTLGETSPGGSQTVTVDMKSSLSPLREGLLLPLVTYTVHLTGGIEDEDGTALESVTWSFRIVGPEGPAIGGAGDDPSPFTAAAATSRTTNGCVVTFNSAVLDLNPVGMKQLQGFFDKLTMDTCGDETGNAAASIVIEPLE